MTQERWEECMDTGCQLTEEEMKEGWHYCMEWDGLLVNYNDKGGEADFCTKACGKPE